MKDMISIFPNIAE